MVRTMIDPAVMHARRVVESLVTALLDDDRETAAVIVQAEPHPDLLALVAAELAAYLLRGGRRDGTAAIISSWRAFCLEREADAGTG